MCGHPGPDEQEDQSHLDLRLKPIAKLYEFGTKGDSLGIYVANIEFTKVVICGDQAQDVNKKGEKLFHYVGITQLIKTRELVTGVGDCVLECSIKFPQRVNRNEGFRVVVQKRGYSSEFLHVQVEVEVY